MFGAAGFLGVKGRRCVAQQSERDTRIEQSLCPASSATLRIILFMVFPSSLPRSVSLRYSNSRDRSRPTTVPC